MHISQKELDELRDSKERLTALENAGVDNWEGYGIALESYNACNALRQQANDVTDEIAEILAGGVFEPSERGAGWAFTDDVLHQARNYMHGFLKDNADE